MVGHVVASARFPYGADVQTSGLDLAPVGRLVGLILVAVLALGCGSSDSEPGAEPIGDGPRVAHPRFDGEFTIVELSLDGGRVGLDQRPSLQIETEFGGLTVMPGCNTYFGSFTLAEDGSASFTVTGGSELDCGPLTDQEAAVLAALDQATAWSEGPGGFRFEGPTGAIDVAGPGG